MIAPSFDSVGHDKQRWHSLDAIKALAIVAVVVQHSGVTAFGRGWTPWDTALRTTWVGFHVPAFLIVAGFLYASDTPLYFRDLARRVSRIGIPYLLVSPLTWWIMQPGYSLGYALATASAHGTYYFFMAMLQCIGFSWLLSRLPITMRWILFGGLFAYLMALKAMPGLRLSSNLFWASRDPLMNFYLGYFLLGWLVSNYRAPLSDLLRTHSKAIAMAAIIFILPSVLRWFGTPMPITDNSIRVFYTLGVVTLIILFMRGRSAPALLQRLSDETLAIYLAHILIIHAALPFTLSWHPVLRIVVLASLALIAAHVLASAARLLLGPNRARTLLGA